MASAAPRGERKSFDKIFGGGPSLANDGSSVTVHELFSAAVREEISLPELAEALHRQHDIRFTNAAVRLVQSSDFSSGRVSFQQFQKALHDTSGPVGDAGKPITYTDQAAAIIVDNSGPAMAPQSVSTNRPSTDISKDAFVKREKAIQKGAARGPFEHNPVVKTNATSMGNMMAVKHVSPDECEGDVRAMVNTATRMFIGGEMSVKEYEAFFVELGIKPSIDSELRKLVYSHERTGDGNFVKLTRALLFEFDEMEKASGGQ